MNAQVHSSGSTETVGGVAHDYPVFPERIPSAVVSTSHYEVRFAMGAADLEAVQRLRYAVFNLELHEGLDASHADGKDVDPFDRCCHHLMVIQASDGAVIGTYRVQTLAMARAGQGYYADTLFDLSGLPAEVQEQGIETGRACIAADHRNGRVLFLLWQGLACYMKHNSARYLFGCSSLTSQDPEDGLAVQDRLRREGHVHDSIRLEPRPGHECVIEEPSIHLNPPAKVPQLMRLYLEYGAVVCGPPAIDRDFKTIDFFTLLDVQRFDARTRKKFFG